MSQPSIIRSPELARRMGISPNTLWKMQQRQPALNACICDGAHSRPWWSVKRLIDAGFLLHDQPSTQTPSPSESVA